MSETSENLTTKAKGALVDGLVKYFIAGILLFVALWGDDRWEKKSDAKAEFVAIRSELAESRKGDAVENKDLRLQIIELNKQVAVLTVLAQEQSKVSERILKALDSHMEKSKQP